MVRLPNVVSGVSSREGGPIKEPKPPTSGRSGRQPNKSTRDLSIHMIPLKVLTKAFEISSGDMELVVIDKELGTATVYNSSDLAMQALQKLNNNSPGRYTKFNFKPQ